MVDLSKVKQIQSIQSLLNDLDELKKSNPKMAEKINYIWNHLFERKSSALKSEDTLKVLDYFKEYASKIPKKWQTFFFSVEGSEVITFKTVKSAVIYHRPFLKERGEFKRFEKKDVDLKIEEICNALNGGK